MSRYSIQNFILLFASTVFFTLTLFCIDLTMDGAYYAVSIAYLAGLVFFGFATALVIRIWYGPNA
jgi:hypothetical protein